MKPGFEFQKVLLGISILGAVGGVLLIAFAKIFGKLISYNTGWLVALAVPVAFLVAFGSAALFLLVRLVQRDGLGTGAILFAVLLTVGPLVGAAAIWFGGQAARDPVRESNQQQLIALVRACPKTLRSFGFRPSVAA